MNLTIYQATYSALGQMREVYFGITNDLESRVKSHHKAVKDGSPTKFHKRMRELGPENFQFRPVYVLNAPDRSKGLKAEKELIQTMYQYSGGTFTLLNTSHTSSKSSGNDRTLETLKALPKVDDAIKWSDTAFGGPLSPKEKILMLTGKLKPCIELESGDVYNSMSEAAGSSKGDDIAAIRNSCKTGRPTMNGKRYALLDFGGAPILTDGHLNKIGRRRKVVNLETGDIFEDVIEATKKHRGESVNSVTYSCNGTYKTTSAGRSFCYVNDDGKPDLKPKHLQYLDAKAMKDSEPDKGRPGFVAWEQDIAWTFKNEKASISQCVFRETMPQLLKSLSRTSESDYAHALDVCAGKRVSVKGYRFAKAFKRGKTITPTLLDKHITGTTRPKSQTVICFYGPPGDFSLENSKEFPNYSQAAKHADENGLLDRNLIAKCCLGEISSVGKRKLRFAHLDKNGNPILKPRHLGEGLKGKKDGVGQRITLYPSDGSDFIHYKSIAECSAALEIPRKTLEKDNYREIAQKVFGRNLLKT